MSRYFLTVRMLNYAFLPRRVLQIALQFMLCASSTSTSFFLFCRQHFIPPSHHMSFYPQLRQLSPASFSQLLNIVITMFSLLSMWKLISKEEKLRLCWVLCAASRHPHWKKNLVCFLLLLSDIRAYQKATNISFMFKLFTECLFETQWDCLLDLHTQL